MKNIYDAIETLEQFKKAVAVTWFSYKKLTSHQLAFLDQLIHELSSYAISTNQITLLKIDKLLTNELQHEYKNIDEILINPKRDLLDEKSNSATMHIKGNTRLRYINQDKKPVLITIDLDENEQYLLEEYTKKNNLIKLKSKEHGFKELFFYSLLQKNDLEILKRSNNFFQSGFDNYIRLLHEIHILIIGCSIRMESTLKQKKLFHRLHIETIKSICQYADLILPMSQCLEFRDINYGNCLGMTTFFLQDRLYGDNPFGIRPNVQSPFGTVSSQMSLNHFGRLTNRIAKLQSEGDNRSNSDLCTLRFKDKRKPLIDLASACGNKITFEPRKDLFFWLLNHHPHSQMQPQMMTNHILWFLKIIRKSKNNSKLKIGLEIHIDFKESTAVHSISVYSDESDRYEFVDSNCGWFKCDNQLNFTLAWIELMNRLYENAGLRMMNAYSAKENFLINCKTAHGNNNNESKNKLKSNFGYYRDRCGILFTSNNANSFKQINLNPNKDQKIEEKKPQPKSTSKNIEISSLVKRRMSIT